jgi:hypothetical protein
MLFPNIILEKSRHVLETDVSDIVVLRSEDDGAGMFNDLIGMIAQMIGRFVQQKVTA